MNTNVTITAAVVSLGVVLWAAPAGAQTRYGATIADPWGGLPPPQLQPPQYYNDYPAAYRPFYSVPRYYPGGGYYDLRRFGNPNSRDALDTCSYC